MTRPEARAMLRIFGLAVSQSSHGNGLKSERCMVRRFAGSVNARADHG